MKKATRKYKSVQSLLINEQMNNTNIVEAISDTNRLLMSPSEKKTRDIMKAVGWDSSLREVEQAVESEADRTNVKKSFKSDDVYKLDEIEKVALEAALYLVRVERFKCPSKFEKASALLLREFVDKNEINFNVNNFYVLTQERYIKNKSFEFQGELGSFYFYKPPKSSKDFVYVGNVGGDHISYWTMLSALIERSLIARFLAIFIASFFLSSLLIGMAGGDLSLSLSTSLIMTAGSLLNKKNREAIHSKKWLNYNT
jgi:hypothetical protein